MCINETNPEHIYCGEHTIPLEYYHIFATVDCDPNTATEFELDVCDKTAVIWKECEDSSGDM